MKKIVIFSLLGGGALIYAIANKDTVLAKLKSLFGSNSTLSNVTNAVVTAAAIHNYITVAGQQYDLPKSKLVSFLSTTLSNVHIFFDGSTMPAGNFASVIPNQPITFTFTKRVYQYLYMTIPPGTDYRGDLYSFDASGKIIKKYTGYYFQLPAGCNETFYGGTRNVLRFDNFDLTASGTASVVIYPRV